MKKQNLENTEDLNISFFYSFQSPIGDIDNQRYVTDIDIEICTCNAQGAKIEKIGHATLKILLLGLATHSGYDHYDVFDTDQMLFTIGEDIYDFEWGSIKEEVKKELKFDYDHDIVKISYIEILPEYRKIGLGKKLIKDIYNRFSNSCCMFVVSPFPIQHDKSQNKNSVWYKKMQYDSLISDFETGKKKLQKFYSSLGFMKSKIAKDYMFLITEHKNDKLDSVILDFK